MLPGQNVAVTKLPSTSNSEQVRVSNVLQLNVVCSWNQIWSYGQWTRCWQLTCVQGWKILQFPGYCVVLILELSLCHVQLWYWYIQFKWLWIPADFSIFLMLFTLWDMQNSEMKYRFQVSMAGSVQTVVFCASAVCNIVCGYRYRGTCCLHLQDWLQSKNGRSVFLQNVCIYL